MPRSVLYFINESLFLNGSRLQPRLGEGPATRGNEVLDHKGSKIFLRFFRPWSLFGVYLADPPRGGGQSPPWKRVGRGCRVANPWIPGVESAFSHLSIMSQLTTTWTYGTHNSSASQRSQTHTQPGAMHSHQEDKATGRHTTRVAQGTPEHTSQSTVYSLPALRTPNTGPWDS